MSNKKSTEQPILDDESMDSPKVVYQSLHQAVVDFINETEYKLDECNRGNAKYSDFITDLEDRLNILKGEVDC